MKFESIVERKFFKAFVFPKAADAAFIVETIFIFGIQNYVFSCFGRIRFRFLEFFTSGEEENKTKKNKDDLFQNNASFQRVIKVSTHIITRFDIKIKSFFKINILNVLQQE